MKMPFLSDRNKGTENMNVFYFDTGVKPHNRQSTMPGQVWKNGTLQIPFEADAPADAFVLFLSQSPDELDRKAPNVIVREVKKGEVCGKYAYFRLSCKFKNTPENSDSKSSNQRDT